MNKEFKQVVSAMIKSILHLFKIHGKMIFGNPSIVVQDMFGKTPKAFNAVYVVFRLSIDQMFRMINLVMFSPALQGVVASELVGVIDRPLPCLLSDNRHQFLSRDSLHNSCIHPAIAFQKAKYNAFAFCPASTPSLASAAKVALVHFNLARQLATLQFRYMVYRFTQALVDAGDSLVIDAEIMCKFVGRLHLVEAFQYIQLSFQLPKRLLFSTGLVSAANVTTMRPIGLERTTENTLFASRKVGCAPENVLLPLCHMDNLVPYGYDYH